MSSQFVPLSYDLITNSAESNVVVGRLVSGEIKLLHLFACDPGLFQALREEVMGIVTTEKGQTLEEGHPTFDYVARWDPDWKPKPNLVHQYSLYNSRHDLRYFDEDHNWYAGKSFNPRLKSVPEFATRYFHESELQNFRIQGIAGGGDLGQHRERIIAIPKREQHYKLRFHLPIVTNPQVRFLMDGQTFQMQEGHVYLFNQSCMHGVANEGQDLRVHLVWDFYLNDFIATQVIAPAFIRSAAAR